MPNLNTKRLFIALRIPSQVQKEIARVTRNLGSLYTNVRWVKAENTHITLHFLGDMGSEREQAILDVMSEFEHKNQAADFSIHEINGFPNRYQPTIIYLACMQKNGNSAITLQNALGNKLLESGIPLAMKRWTPHISLGRVSGTGVVLPLDITAKVNMPKLNFSARYYDLVEAFLKPDGAEYETVKSFEL